MSNLTIEEKKAGQRAARKLRRELKTILATSTIRQSGTMLKLAGSGIEMKYDGLNAIIIKASKVTFIQNYGFEGIKSNGIAMKLKPYGHLNKLFNNTKALERLADDIGAIRLDKITNKIHF